MKTFHIICLLLVIVLEIHYGETAKCSITASSFETEFCTIKQEIEAVKQFDSRISNTEHELLTLKHNVQVETAELKDNQDLIRDIQKNISDAISVNNMSTNTSDLNDKMDKLLKMFKDVQDRLDHLEVKCKVCGSNGSVNHPCSQNPCSNGGKCLELSKDFQCVCTIGFTGERCQYTDHCSSSPCKNGGSCSSNILGHVCNCVIGFTGPYCEVKINACDSNPCKHGTCLLHGNSFSCQCEHGYDGSTCEHSTGQQGTSLSTAKPTTIPTTIQPQSTVTYPDPCAKASVCNEPAKCQAVGSQDYKCVCPDTALTNSDNCLEPYYYDQFGFCCARNTCKNNEIVC
ncbi:adhesive plaque matrix protein 2-like [Mytilus edulis]|uniref:adhesive plaque matrix protein 2-like n=1 Tax=Mytilus edulis TaxID=6550 RepID=UPI0039EE2FD9